MHPFRAAIEAGDLSSVPALLAPGVTFLSPVAFAPYEGRDLVAGIIRAAFRVFDDFAYVREIESADGRDHALIFQAKVAGRDLQGCDFLHHDADGLISEFTVMVRPLSAAKSLADAMAVEFETVKQELGLLG